MLASPTLRTTKAKEQPLNQSQNILKIVLGSSLATWRWVAVFMDYLLGIL